ncbi:Hypothetical predicted protein [Lecanosticta acicola]|uniref:DUF7905 domain-containing protein n=1 Tax=Lecanosticta acicola TaxID=111012 RepID=A0AAI9E8G4_9PEZI|nr:Hypothetical predicted protein [Lecanosticta acicola]
MDDYELVNARQWDGTLKDASTAEDSSPSEWHVVSNTNKKRAKGKENVSAGTQRLPTRGAPPFRQRPQQLRSAHSRSPQKPGPVRARARHPVPRPTPLPPRREPPRLVDVADNEAQYSWRERKPATDTIKIPAIIIMGDRGPDGDGPNIIERLALEKGAFIHSDEKKSSNASLTFGIWGDAKNAAAAKKAILNWIEVAAPSGKSDSSSNFARVVSLTEELRKRAEKSWKRDIKKNRFRQFPPSDMAFEAIGTFHWPATESRPEDAFGMSCEVLDPIRMDCECYIKHSSERSLFQVCGKSSSVRTALVRIRRTCYQMAARSLNPVRAYMLHWRDRSAIPSHVFLDEYHEPDTIPIPAASRDVPSHSPRAQGDVLEGDDESAALGNSTFNAERVRITFANALTKLHYYRGRLQLRIHLGTFVLGTYIPPEDDFYDLAEYEAMTKESQFTGRVTEELGDKALESIALARLQAAPDLVHTHDFFTSGLFHAKPTLSAVFTFPNERGDLRLSMSWHQAPDEGGEMQFAEPSVKWSRLDRDTGRETKLVDMSLTNLHQSSALQFELSTTETVENLRIPIILKNFADRVRIDPSAISDPFRGKPFVMFSPYVQPKTLRQSVSYQYGVRPSDYTLEIAQFQDRVYTDPRKPPEVYEPRWSLNVFRPEWDTLFSENERLPVGTRADWDDAIETWFPAGWDCEEGTDGFQQLLEMLGRIERIVREEPLQQSTQEEGEMI